jgi:hypothetical protein
VRSPQTNKRGRITPANPVHFYLRPPRRSSGPADVFERVVGDAHAAASAQEHPLTVAAGTVTVDEQVEVGFTWLLDSIEAASSAAGPTSTAAAESCDLEQTPAARTGEIHTARVPVRVT